MPLLKKPLRPSDGEANELAVVCRPTAELSPDPRNPRRHSRRRIRQIARSITCFGFSVPILVDRDEAAAAAALAAETADAR